MHRYLTVGTGIAGLFYIVVMPSLAAAQIEDPQERRAWLAMQQISVRATSIWNCFIQDQVEGALRNLPSPRPSETALSQKYKAAREDLAREIDSFVSTYAHKHRSETKHSFTYTVWQVMLHVGKEEARQASAEGCARIVDQP